MSSIVTAQDLTAQEKRILFWASFLSLAAAGFGFAFRVAMGGEYAAEFHLTDQQAGQVMGATFWPIAITMIGFSLLVDKTGYKLPMYGAFVLQALAGIGTYFAESYGALYAFAICAGLGHGIVEAVINPICAAVYPKEKTKWLTILHAAWPAGLVFGTLLIIGSESYVEGWRFHSLWMVLPAIVYAALYARCRFPMDERVQAGIPFREMLQQVGFLGAALASFLVIYEVGNQVGHLTSWEVPADWFNYSIYAGVGVGLLYGFAVRAIGKPLFFLMCLLMIPLATAELATDGWIKALMTPVLKDVEVNPAFALVFSAFIMLILRIFAGGILKFFSPPGLLCVSGIFSAIGLYWLSSAAGAAIFVAFVLYALGQTYYWPCVLGFVSERYPQGGALTLNTVSAIGLLSFGIIGAPILGAEFDSSTRDRVVAAEAEDFVNATTVDGSFMWMKHKKIDPDSKAAFLLMQSEADAARLTTIFKDSKEAAGRDVLAYAVRFPVILLVAFGLIALWFRAQGGYKPVQLKGRD